MIVFVVKLTALLAAGLAGSALLRSRSAALRHLMLTATLAGAIALAALVRVVPTIPIPVPDFAAPTTAPLGAATPVAGAEHAPTTSASMSARTRSTTHDDGAASRGFSGRSALAAAWLAGVVVAIAWWLLGHAGLARLAARAQPVTAPAWRDLLAELAAASGVRRRVTLRCTPEVGSPVVWGVRRPMILLPANAESWSAERRRVVLAHELAHVARGDGVVNAVAHAAATLYWFHPLAWLALRRLRIESEHACDDRVLLHGTHGADYATHLLEVARAARGLRLAAPTAIGMARPSHLEGRLLAVLDECRPRGEPDLGARLVLGVALALGVPLLAAARAAPPAPTESTESTEPTVRLAAADAPSDSVIERTLEAADGERLTLDLESGASVEVRGWDEPRAQFRVRLGGHDADATRVDITRVADGIRVHMRVDSSGQMHSTSHAIEISVPRHYDLHLDSAGGDLSLSDLDGSFDGTTGGGSLTLERVNGEARLKTGGGDIRVSDADLRGKVSTGGGSVVFSNVAGTLRGSSGSGPVIYREQSANGGKDAGRLHLSRAGGDITLDEITDGADLETGGGDIRVERARGYVTASTGGGDIDIEHVDGGVRAGTGAGRIRISVDDLHADGRGIDLGTGNGDIVIELPPDVAATFDLETAYTEGYRRKTRIDSDWALDQTETDTWDDRRGTPRKYVRARGETGGGGPLVKIRSVNGDITVRRVGAP